MALINPQILAYRKLQINISNINYLFSPSKFNIIFLKFKKFNNTSKNMLIFFIFLVL